MKIFRYYNIKEKKALETYLKSGENANAAALKTAGRIIAAVRRNGDKAVFSYCKIFDNFKANKKNIKVKESEINTAFKNTPKSLISALKTAKLNIEKFHMRQKEKGFKISVSYGKLGMKVLPLKSAGLYIPGGKAVYPSSVLMNVIPAKIAGVARIILCTPALNGKVDSAILVAAKICGVNEIYKIGGAQAIAAMAYGTETVKPVDKITGPGNAYVSAAKQLVFGKVGIDSLAGPSEVLIVAGNGDNPSYVAADMLAQSEHDEEARSILITDSMAFAGKVMFYLFVQKPLLLREKIIARAIKNSFIVIVDKISDAAAISNLVAPEHLELIAAKAVKEADTYTNAGAVFIGAHTPVALGDYIAGTNHVLPTNGAARYSSPLGVYDFVKRQTTAEVSKKGLSKLAGALKILALTEGLEAHYKSVEKRLGK
ncbi:MAG: histidinol dehydrogenase [Candidatus Firestonebacteria bacterium]